MDKEIQAEKDEIAKMIFTEKAQYLKTYDKAFLPNIVSNVKKYLTLEANAGIIQMTKLEIAKVDETNFGRIIDYIISNNKGYIEDYKKYLQFGI